MNKDIERRFDSLETSQFFIFIVLGTCLLLLVFIFVSEINEEPSPGKARVPDCHNETNWRFIGHDDLMSTNERLVCNYDQIHNTTNVVPYCIAIHTKEVCE